MDPQRRNLLRKDMNATAGMLFLYQACLYIVVNLFSLSALSSLVNQANLTGQQIIDYLNSPVENGWGPILGTVLGAAIIFWSHRRKLLAIDWQEKDKKMTRSVFVSFFFVLTSFQLLFNVLAVVAESALNVFGYTIMDDIAAATSTNAAFSMFLYTSFVAPVAEELVFRGAVLKGLEKYGKIFAIFISALLFGAYHLTLIQGVYAAAVGILLGYVTLEYSIKWAILLHFINNFVLGYVLTYILSPFSPAFQSMFYLVFLFVSFLLGVFILYRNRRLIRDYLVHNQSDKKLYLYGLTSLGILLLLVLSLLISLSAIEPI